MAVNYKPEGYTNLQPYLMVQDGRAAIAFYKEVLGATEVLVMPRPEGGVAHAELQIGDSRIMLSDENPKIGAFAPAHYGGSPVSLHVYVPDCDAAYRRALGAGAKGEREPEDQFYGDRSAGFVDPFGHRWYLATHKKSVSNEEAQKLYEESAAKAK